MNNINRLIVFGMIGLLASAICYADMNGKRQPLYKMFRCDHFYSLPNSYILVSALVEEVVVDYAISNHIFALYLRNLGGLNELPLDVYIQNIYSSSMTKNYEEIFADLDIINLDEFLKNNHFSGVGQYLAKEKLTFSDFGLSDASGFISEFLLLAPQEKVYTPNHKKLSSVGVDVESVGFIAFLLRNGFGVVRGEIVPELFITQCVQD
jgi:hypothetical protein